MGYDLNGKKLILSVNVVKFDGLNQDRIGTEVDEEKIIKTFQVSRSLIFLILLMSFNTDRGNVFLRPGISTNPSVIRNVSLAQI